MDRRERDALDRHLTDEPSWRTDDVVYVAMMVDDDASEFTKIIAVSRFEDGLEDRFRVFWRTCGIHPHGVWKDASYRDGTLACPGDDWSNLFTAETRAEVLAHAQEVV